MIQFIEGRKNISKILAIPYLGDCNKENSYLVKYSGKADFAFMHTDISKMKFDNGMTVVGAVDADKFSGRVISGHIHKRQETKKVIYVGSPYHLSKSDIGNTKGIYRIDLTTGEFEFTENKYSPIFNRIDITLFMNFTEKERYEAMNNNYIDIMSDEETNKKFKMTDVYEIIDKCTARRAEIKTAKSKDEINAGTDEDCAELSISELIVSAVDGLENTEEQEKETLKKMALKYLKEAQDEMNI
jgi:DNA repair exonuclease SbcCD nuclease subunit